MPKTKEQFQAIKEERADSILRSALPIFTIKGYDGTSIDEIAKAANCSHGLLYHYYKNKDDLFHEMMELIVVPYVRSVRESVDLNQKASYALHDLINAHLNALKSDNDELCMSIYLILNMHLQRTVNLKRRPSNRKRLGEYIMDLIERGQYEGDFTKEYSSREITMILMTSLKGLSYNRIMLGSKKFCCPHSEPFMRMIYK